MAKTTTGFQCSVITPEAAVLETEATAASFPAHDGEFGILRDRAPLVCKLGIGALRVETPDGARRFYIDGGFAEVHENRLTILTNSALAPEAIDADRARQALDEAQALRITDTVSLTRRQDAIARAKAQIRLARIGEG